MQQFVINFSAAQGWQKLGDKQLRFVYQHIASDITADEITILRRL